MPTQSQMVVMVALGCDGLLPEVEDGNHLRWQFSPVLGFPAGFDIYRRPHAPGNSVPLPVSNAPGAILALPEVYRRLSLQLRLDGGPGTVTSGLFGVPMIEVESGGNAGATVTVELEADAINEVRPPAGTVTLAAQGVPVSADSGLGGWGQPLNLQRIGLPNDWNEAADRLRRRSLPGGPVDLPAGMSEQYGGQMFQDLLQRVIQPIRAGSGASRIPFTSPGVSPALELDGYSLVLLAAIDPNIARILGLLWVDRTAALDFAYDYKVVASWPAPAPDPDPPAWICYNVTRRRPTSLELPYPVQAFPLPAPTAGDAPLLRPSTVKGRHGLSAGLRWRLPARSGAISRSAVAYHIYRQDLGDGNFPVHWNPSDFALSFRRLTEDWLGNVTVARPVAVSPDTAELQHPPFAAWPANPYYIDRDAPQRWYTYAVRGVDVFGRLSEPAFQQDLREVELRDPEAPPPPVDVRGRFLDPNATAGDADYDSAMRQLIPAGGDGALLLRWSWPSCRYRQAPDAREFRIYWQSGRLNTYAGEITTVDQHGSFSTLTVRLNGRPFAAPLTDAWLQSGADRLHIVWSDTNDPLMLDVTNLRLTRDAAGRRRAPAPGPCVIAVGSRDEVNYRPPGEPSAWASRIALAQVVPPLEGRVVSVAPWSLSGTLPPGAWTAQRDGTSEVQTSFTLRDASRYLHDAVLSVTGRGPAALDGCSEGRSARLFIREPAPAPAEFPFTVTASPASSLDQAPEVLEVLTDLPLANVPQANLDHMIGGSLLLAQSLQAGVNRYYSWNRTGAGVDVETGARLPLTSAGKLAALRVKTAVNTLNGPATVTVMLNGAATALSVAVPPAGASAAADRGDIPVTADSQISIRVAAGGSAGEIAGLAWSLEFAPASENVRTINGGACTGEFPVVTAYLKNNQAAFSVVTGGLTPAAGLCAWFPAYEAVIANPGLAIAGMAPAAYGAVAVSAADEREYVSDWKGDPQRRGNEGKLSPPVVVVRPRRVPVTAPATPVRNQTYATPPDYFSRSYYELSWPPIAGPGTAYLVYRALDVSLFFRDLEQRRAASGYYTGGTPDGMFEAWFAAHPPAGVSKGDLFTDPSGFDEDKRRRIESAWQGFYASLADEQVQELANRAGNETVFVRLHSTPLVTPSFRDTLDGRSTNRFLYRLRVVDAASNQSALGGSSLPVYIPDVIPPRPPALLQAAGSDRKITLRWVPNREADLDSYLVYRSVSSEAAQDLRTMQRIGRVAKEAVEFEDTVTANVTQYYRLVAVDQAGNRSGPSAAMAGRAYQAPPAPPVWNPPQRQPAVNPTVISLSWTHPTDQNLRCLIERRTPPDQPWISVSGWLREGVYTFDDRPSEILAAWEYRLRVRDNLSQTAATMPTTQLSLQP